MSNRYAALVAGILLAAVWAMVGAGPACAEDLALPVPKATIYPNDVIDDSLLGERLFIAHTVARSSVFAGRQEVVGKVARRTLVPGQPIPINAVREAYMVNQGKMAAVVFEDGGLTITGSALALQNGAAGEVVTMRNVDSGVVIRGTVGANGVVRLGAP